MELSRSEERRIITIQEIKTLAWKQLAQEGPTNLSLRAISREMRMSSAALFRYYKDRNALISALCQEAFTGINQAMEDAARPDSCHAEKLANSCLAYREWAIHNPEKYALIYGSPITGYQPDWPNLLDSAKRGLEIILELVQNALVDGEIDIQAITCDMSDRLLSQMTAITQSRGYNIPPEALYTSIVGWTRLHGMVSLEVFGHIMPLLPDPELFYRKEVLALLKSSGYRQIPDLLRLHLIGAQNE